MVSESSLAKDLCCVCLAMLTISLKGVFPLRFMFFASFCLLVVL